MRLYRIFYILAVLLTFLFLTSLTSKTIRLFSVTPEPAKTFSPVSSVEVPIVPQLPKLPDGLVLVQYSNIDGRISSDFLWFETADGIYSKHELYTDDVSITHDGMRLAYIDGHSIWVINLQDATRKELAMPQNLDMTTLVWSPDDSNLAFWGGQNGLSSDIFILNLSSGLLRNVTNTSDRMEFPLNWASGQPETMFVGSEILRKRNLEEMLKGSCHTTNGVCDQYLALISIDGSKYELLDKSSSIEYPPAITPDGKLLFFDGGTILHLDSGWIEKITPKNSDIEIAFSYDSYEPQLVSPVISPDGKRVAWLGHVNSNGDNGIYIYEIKTHKWNLVVTYLHEFFNSSLSPEQTWESPFIRWSPDSQWLSIEGTSMTPIKSWLNGVEGKTKGIMWIINMDDGTIKSISTGDISEYAPVWSPDSKNITFFQKFVGTFDLDKTYVLNIQNMKINELPVPQRTIPIYWR